MCKMAYAILELFDLYNKAKKLRIHITVDSQFFFYPLTLILILPELRSSSVLYFILK